MKRKIKKKGLILATGICVVAAAVMVSVPAVRKTGETETVSVGENQRIVYGYLTSVLGNEISYREVETSVAEAMLERQTEKSDEKTETGNGERSDGAQSGRGRGMKQENAVSDGETSSETGEENAPGEASRSGERASDTDPQQGKGMQPGTESGESVTALIPVGTAVHTTADTETTFSRLAAGDFVKLLLETTEDGGETIVEIWMLQ